MDDLTVPQIDQFSLQANLHHQICDSLTQIANSFDVHYAIISSQLDTSQVAHYEQWWQQLKRTLLQHADLHNQLGNTLLRAGGDYQSLEEDIIKSMQPTNMPSN